ncbi:hypothetical protein GCM10011390_03330 [Aureimonas endophytica]|uniref:Uncharacterized protein n=1 Tax=Aureimonas endophytica TaxID=2027858 RepID=A0A916ZDE6_9HYPH|nr:hypothetical protein [Aureimonas endophytica]GGD87899.1 hypothetical protein GCM10011390_03330 [Aureimonas endophytica]
MIKTTPTADGKRISISFPYDPKLVATVKTIPGAKWDGASWTVAKRYSKQVEAFAGVAANADAAYDALIETKNPEIKKAAGGIVSVRIDRKNRIADVSPLGMAWLGPVGNLQGARSQKDWNGKFRGYHVPIATEDRIGDLIEAIAAVVEGERARKAEIEAARAARAAEQIARAVERADRMQADIEAGRGRKIYLLARVPDVGKVVRIGSSAKRITGHGKAWRLGDDSSAYGIDPSWEGELVCYAYYEPASEAETAALVERETAAEAAEATRGRRADAIRQIDASTDAPEVGSEPDGETIWSDDSAALGGWRRWVVLTPDGWLWSLTYAGGDGDSWGMRNCGYCTRGVRIRATEDLVAAIKA